MSDLREKLRECVRTLLGERGHGADVQDDKSLVNSGLLDSLAVLQIAVFMEKEFGIDFSVVYFDQNIFDSILSMEDFVRNQSVSV